MIRTGSQAAHLVRSVAFPEELAVINQWLAAGKGVAIYRRRRIELGLRSLIFVSLHRPPGSDYLIMPPCHLRHRPAEGDDRFAVLIGIFDGAPL